ncbi:MAG: hypothetical protein LBN04_09525 [Oscillospiraceae bacterium]|jgi:hypothetical protein|nr:hypothetical protein [Oscillospiraceae bacterium]
MMGTKEGLMLGVVGFVTGALWGQGVEKTVAQPSIDWVAVAAVGISLVSIVATIVFSLLQQRHNKNSVRPICYMQFEDKGSQNEIIMIIRNVGTGPLTIKKIECRYGTHTAKTLMEVIPEEIRNWVTFVMGDITGCTFAIGETIKLITISTTNEMDMNQVRRKLMNIGMNIIYTDIYGKSRFTAQWLQEDIGLYSQVMSLDPPEATETDQTDIA